MRRPTRALRSKSSWIRPAPRHSRRAHQIGFTRRHPRPNFQLAEFAATGSILPLDELVVRDKIDANDWLIPLEQTKVNGRLLGLQQDYRIPILIYRKSRFADAQVTTPPRTYDEVGALGARLTKNNTIGYAIPIGLTGASEVPRPSSNSY